MTAMNDRGAPGLAAAFGLSALILYGSRLCPDLCLTGDSAELVTVAAVWGVAHAPGYPLFTALAHAFVAIPMGTVAWRVHLTSALFHAGALAAVVEATFALTRSRLAAAAAGIACGGCSAFFLGSLYADVFPLNDLFFACLLGIAMRIHGSGRLEMRAAVALFLCSGVAAGHHPMIWLGAPSLVVLVWRPLTAFVAADRRRLLLLLAVFVLPPLLSYAFVPLAAAREPYVSWGDVHDLRSLFALALRSDYGGPLRAARTLSAAPGIVRLGAFADLAVDGAGAIALGVAGLGIAAAASGQPRVSAGLLLAILVPGPVFAWMNAVEVQSEPALAFFQRFTTMADVPIGIAFGMGFAALRRWAASGNLAARAAAVLVLAAWLVARAYHTRTIDLRADRRGISFAHDLVLGSPDRSLILLSGDEPAAAAAYVCGVERRCGERIVLSPGTLVLPWAMAQTRRRHPELRIPWSSGPALARTHEIVAAEATDRPVFVYPDLLVKDPTLKQSFAYFPDGLLWRLWAPGTDPAPERAAFLASVDTMAQARCQGCLSSPPVLPRPSQDVQIVLAYAAAFHNHAVRAADLGATEAARLLEQRAVATAADYGGGVSMSR